MNPSYPGADRCAESAFETGQEAPATAPGDPLVPRSKLGASNRVQGGEAVCVFPLSPAASPPKLLAHWRLERRASYRRDADVFLRRAQKPLWLLPRWRPQSQNQQELATCSFRPPEALRL